MEIVERLKDFTFGAMVLRLALAMLCGGAIGYGRSKKERPAGMRTYMLVCLGAASAVLVLMAETLFNALGRKIRHTPDYSLEIFYNEKDCLDEVLRYCKDSRMAIVNLKIHTLDGKGPSLYVADVKVRGNTRPDPLTEHISHMTGVVSVAAL